MDDTLKPLYGRVPDITNAHMNRIEALRMFRAGFTPAEIAQHFPLVFECIDGKLQQKYDSYYVASVPDTIKETKFTINPAAVTNLTKGKDHGNL